MILSIKKSGLFTALSLSLQPVFAAPQFVASEIPRADQDDRIYLADMDGDGKSDVLLGHWSEQQGRELYIYLQQADGRFPSLPSRKVEIRPEIIAFGTADLRAEPGAELVFVSSDAVYSFSPAIESYSGNLKKLVDWPSIASTPEREEIAYLGAMPDLDNDGHADLLLADEEGFGYFRGQGDERFNLVSRVITVSGNPASVERRSRSGETGIRAGLTEAGEIDISIVPATSSEFRRFLNEWRPDVPAGAGLLSYENWIPAAGFGTVNDDALTDLVFINDADGGGNGDNNEEQRQISVLLQNAADGFAAQADWQAGIEPRGTWRLYEFTGDALVDLLRISGEATDPAAYFYRNTAGVFNLERPDQVLRFSGLGLDVDFSDLDNDGKPELSVSYFSVPVLDAIRSTSIQRSHLIFANVAVPETPGQESGLLFSRRADYKRDESISADSILGLTSFGNLQVDLDGDTQKDFLQIAGNGTLTARTVDSTNLQIAAEAFWQYVPSHIVVGFTTEELNADARPDIILHHSLHFTLLVSVE